MHQTIFQLQCFVLLNNHQYNCNITKNILSVISRLGHQLVKLSTILLVHYSPLAYTKMCVCSICLVYHLAYNNFKFGRASELDFNACQTSFFFWSSKSKIFIYSIMNIGQYLNVEKRQLFFIFYLKKKKIFIRGNICYMSLCHKKEYLPNIICIDYPHLLSCTHQHFNVACYIDTHNIR